MAQKRGKAVHCRACRCASCRCAGLIVQPDISWPRGTRPLLLPLLPLPLHSTVQLPSPHLPLRLTCTHPLLLPHLHLPLQQRARRALQWLSEDSAQHGGPPVSCLVIAGGVAANKAVRAGLEAVATEFGVPCLCPPVGVDECGQQLRGTQDAGWGRKGLRAEGGDWTGVLHIARVCPLCVGIVVGFGLSHFAAQVN